MRPELHSKPMAGTSTQAICRKDHEDYISLLPDCLIHHIFSFLPTREVIKTCVLSKRWQSVWTAISDLRFDSFYDNNSFVDRVLTHYVWPKVEKFHLDTTKSKQDICYSNIDSWVHFAVDHQVEDLSLIVDLYWEHYTLSPSLYNCSSLTKLCLRGCCFSGEGIRWSSLKSLSIQNVSDDVLQKILMGSPVLEYLNLIGCQGVTRIHSRSLRELVIDAVIVESPLEISTPHLLSLHVRGDQFREMIRIIEAPLLVNAELDFDGPVKSDYSMLKQLLCKLQNTTQIFLGAWCLRVMWPLKASDMQVLLPNCKSLTLHIPCRQFSFPAVANMLETAPNLEKLVIIFEPSDWDDHGSESDWNSRNVDHESYWHMKKKFKSWARSLKNVEILGFDVKYKEVLVLVKFLLGHASILENMVIKVKYKREAVDSHTDCLKWPNDFRVFKELLSMCGHTQLSGRRLAKRWNITTNRLHIKHENT